MGLPNNRVVAVVYDGLCAFEHGVAAELFGLARPRARPRLVSLRDREHRPAAAAGARRPDPGCVNRPERLARAGTIVLPGWRDPAEAPPRALVAAIRRAHDRGARVMSICSGVFVLAATGLLDGRPATTHWRYTERLGRMFPLIDVQPDVLYIDNGATLTSAGSAAGLDLGLHLIRRDFGAETANHVARRLVVSPHRHGGQAQFIDPEVRADADSLSDVLAWASAHLDRPITVDELAGRAHLARRARSPGASATRSARHRTAG